MEAPECLIIAGPNGGGKSTVYRRLQERSKLPVDLLYINTDDNVKILERSSGRSSDIAAARMSIESLNTAIADRQNFAFETTLSSNHSLRTIEKARQAGYRVGLIYVLLRTVELHNARIRTRVAHGGHFVAEADVARRYRTSLRNLAYRLELFDEGYVIDNSGANSPRQLIKVEAGRISKLPDFDAKTAFDIELWDLLSDFEPPW